MILKFYFYILDRCKLSINEILIKKNISICDFVFFRFEVKWLNRGFKQLYKLKNLQYVFIKFIVKLY